LATPDRARSHGARGTPPTGSPPRATGGTLSTVAKTLTLLQAFTFDEPVLGVSDLARRLGLGKSTVHRMLTTLLHEGFVAKTPDDRYRLGFKLYELGQQVVNGLELREVAHPFLEELRNESKETTHLAVLDGTEVIYLERIESPSTLRLFGRVGRRMPAHTTSSGKVILAYLPPEATDAVIATGLRRLGPRTITTRAMFVKALEDVRAQGYAVSMEESEAGVTSVGAPVFGHDGSVIAAVSVAGPSLRMNRESVPRYVRMVRHTAAAISHGMGYRQRKVV
jgi:DNA-binding IclR family transcriptional regulator